MLDDDRGNDIDVDNIDNGFFDIAHSVKMHHEFPMPFGVHIEC